jgi:uncharacterized membrane protein YhhN
MAFLLRYLLFGPIAGIGVAIVQKVAAVGVWAGHGCPDFYFRGWNSAFQEALFYCIGGFLVGLPFGLAICCVKEAWRIRPGQFLVHLWLIAFLAQLLCTSITFAVRPRLLFFPLIPEASAIVSGLLLPLVLPAFRSSEAQLSEGHQ